MLSTMENLAQLEALCEKLYNSLDFAERAHAESSLKCFSVDTEYISQCQYILENASTPYALMLASSSLLKQVTEHRLPLQLRLAIRNYLVNYLATRGPDLEPFVIGSLIQLFCRVTKLGWLGDDRFKEVLKEAENFLSQSPCHYAIGLRILNQLVSEINEPSPGFPSTYNRRIASSFRDQSLFQIFQISLTSLCKVKNEEKEVGIKLQELALLLSLKCLSFDFMGTSSDESSDEIGTVQIPNSWRPLLEDPSTLQIFFDYFAITQGHFSKEPLECLVRLASVRRSLFTDDSTRLKFLSHFMMGTKEILQTGLGLADHDNYHVFCRLLGRFKVNYQLSELVSNECYSEWIQLVAEFTLKSLQSWQWAGSSVYYLLGLWSRMVTSVRYLRSESPNQLNEYVPMIIEGFISSRFEMLQYENFDELLENPLDNVELLQDHLDFFPHLCRFQYERCTTYMIKSMEPILQKYMEGAGLQARLDNKELSLIEAKLAWIVHIVAAIIKTKHIGGVSGESHEVLDAELSVRVLQLINVTDSGLHSRRYGELSKQRLDFAILTFFEEFRKSYVGDQAMHSAKLYARLSELLGLHDHLLLLNAIVGKIMINLKSYIESEEVINRTLNLFLDMVSGYMKGKMLLKMDSIRFLIAQRDHFPFLEDQRHSRSRTTFYYIIGLLIFMEDSLLKFKSSMDHFSQVFVNLESTYDAMFRTDTVKYALIGLMRDLRGIALAADRTYGFLFDWLFPIHMPLLLKGITHWTDTPEVTTPLLKFVAELVLNKSQRLSFESSSPNGILLFQEVSRLIVAYGSRIFSLPNQADMYAFKYKGIWICFTILTRALSGNYVNFGVFELYGDRALIDSLDIALKMALSIPLADILAFQKDKKILESELTVATILSSQLVAICGILLWSPMLTAGYFAFLEVIFNSHLGFILNQETNTFIYIIKSLELGLKSLNANIISQCASSIDNLAAFYFIHIRMGESPTSPAAFNLSQHISDCPCLFPDILKTIFEMILFEDCGCQWSLNKPVLSLILICEEMFTNMKAQILASQPMSQWQRLSSGFDKLMTDVTRTLTPRSKEKFSKSLTRFRNEFRAK